MRLLPVETLEKLYGSRYAVVVLTAKRAMRIREGSEPLVETEARNPLTIAMLELAAGKIHPEEGVPEAEAAELEAAEGAEAEDAEEVEGAEAAEVAGTGAVEAKDVDVAGDVAEAESVENVEEAE